MTDNPQTSAAFVHPNFYTFGTGKDAQVGFASIATTGCVVWVQQAGEQKKDPPIVARANLTGEAFSQLCEWALVRQRTIHVAEAARVEMQELEKWRREHGRK